MASSLSSEGPLRKRTQRACDQCRRRKTKCNGEFNCKSCKEIGLQCSYGLGIRQTSGPKYVVHLEQRLKELESQVRRASTTSSTDRHDDLPTLESQTSSSSLSTLAPVDSAISMSSRQVARRTASQETQGELAVETLGSAIHDNPGERNDAVSIYRGRSTGVEIVRDLRRLCDSFTGLNMDSDESAFKMVDALDAPFPTRSLSLVGLANICFTSEPAVRRWINLAFTEAFALWPFIERDKLDSQVQRLLDQHGFQREVWNDDELGLVHAVIACGQRHDPELRNPERDIAKQPETRGIQHFEAARDLVPLANCSRSVTAVQTILCMAIYAKSVASQRVVHTYVSMAGYAAHQLGLHQTAAAHHLPERDRIVRDRIYITARTFDAYVTCSLGLPRNLRALDRSGHSTNAPYLAPPEELLAATANVELLEILGNTLEKAYFTDAISDEGSAVVDPKHLRELTETLNGWSRKYPYFAQNTSDDLATCTLTQLFSRYSQCFILLVLYCPFVHHIAKPWQSRSPNAYSSGSKCVEAAIQAVQTAEALKSRHMLNEAYCLTVDVLAMAATALLVVELGAPEPDTAETVRETSMKAKTLLEGLAMQNRAAAQCLESLTPLYQHVARAALSAAPSLELPMQDFTLFPMDNTQFPIFDFPPTSGSELLPPHSQLPYANYNTVAANMQSDTIGPRDNFNIPAMWPGWGTTDYSASTLAWIPSDNGAEDRYL